MVVLRIYPQRLIVSSRYTGPVAAACGRDTTGLVGLVLWGEQIKTIRVGTLFGLNLVGVGHVTGLWSSARAGTGESQSFSVLRGIERYEAHATIKKGRAWQSRYEAYP